MDIKINNKKVIFVDCFNTVILRNKNNKQILNTWDSSVSKTYGLKEKQFARLYRKYYIGLAIKNIFKRLMFEPNIKDVLNNIAKKLKHLGIIKNLESFEIDVFNEYLKIEMSSQYLNTKLIQFLEKQKKENKQIYIVSDFYCESEIVKIFLKNLKVDYLFDDVLTSTDYQKEKATSKLYKDIKKKINISSKEIVMIGDNFWSDYLMARLNHLSAHHLKKGDRL